MEYSPSNHHVVMLPFLAHGHLIPFLALAKQIHLQKGFKVTIATTPHNINYLRSTINPEIHLAELPFRSTDHGLPPDTESTENLNWDHIITFVNSTAFLESPFRDFLTELTKKEGGPPLCIISDVFLGWAARIAEEIGTVNLTFITGGAYGYLAYLSIWLNLPNQETGLEEFLVPGFPGKCRFHISLLNRFLLMADGTDPGSTFFRKQISSSLKSFGCLCNTVEEIEPLPLEWLRKFMKIPVWCIGPLLPRVLLEKSRSSALHFYKQRAGKKPGVSVEKCIQWLDSQNPDSVLYISFGSQHTIGPGQMIALAAGLEECRVPFIWVIRPPVGFDLKGEFKEEWLPKGFEERIGKREQGLLVKNWAPQLEILSHRSTGAFVSHCGWNSIIEALSQGIQIIGWPIAAEQVYNSKMLVEEMGVSVEITRGERSDIKVEEVKRVIEMVMEDKGKGGEMRKKAAEVAVRISAAMDERGEEKGSSVRALDDFVSAVLKIRNYAKK